MEAGLKNAAIKGTAEPTTDAPSHNLVDCADRYLTEVKNGKAHSTYCSYEITLRKFLTSCTVATMEEITREHILTWKDEMIEHGAELSSIKNRFRWLKTFLTNYNAAWPMKKTDRITPTEKDVEAYNPEELQALFAAADQEETDLCQFFLNTGFREQETANASWRDIDFIKGLVKVSQKRDSIKFTPKGKKERSIPVPDSLLSILKARRERYPETRLIFGIDGKADGHMLKGAPETW
jgi:integrase/recombinase XerD